VKQTLQILLQIYGFQIPMIF